MSTYQLSLPPGLVQGGYSIIVVYVRTSEIRFAGLLSKVWEAKELTIWCFGMFRDLTIWCYRCARESTIWCDRLVRESTIWCFGKFWAV